MYILEAKNIVKRYANHVALDDVSIQVPKGAVFGLLGPNGAGKTSLIRIINQITAPDQGEILINNERLRQDHVYQIGYLPEERGLYKKMKVGEQALYLAQLKGLSKSDALHKLKYWFEKFEIQDWWGKKVEELSKGMQQKVQFIVTILHEPSILIFDEPFSGFDPINAQMLKDEILNLKAKGATILFSTHNMNSVEEICDEIVLINRAKNILSGKVQDIKQSYNNGYYEIAVHAGPNFMEVLKAEYNLVDLYSVDNGLVRAKIQVKHQITTNELLSSLMSHGTLKEFKEILPSMNDIFIEKVKNTNEHEKK